MDIEIRMMLCQFMALAQGARASRCSAARKIRAFLHSLLYRNVYFHICTPLPIHFIRLLLALPPADAIHRFGHAALLLSSTSTFIPSILTAPTSFIQRASKYRIPSD
jgi:hypothetical protein